MSDIRPERSEPIEFTHPEAKIFPITKQAVKEGLKAIALNPEQDIADELRFLQNTNQDVYDLIKAEAEQVGDPRFMHGVAAAMKFIRIQSELNGRNLADVDLNPHAITWLMGIKDKSQPNHNEANRKWQELEIKEPELVKGIEQITQYDPSQRFFKLGVLELLNIFNEYREAAKIRRIAGR